jgi:hypothetical protein
VVVVGDRVGRPAIGAHLVDRAAGESDEIELSESPTPQRRPTRLLEDLASGALPIKQAASRLRLVL